MGSCYGNANAKGGLSQYFNILIETETFPLPHILTMVFTAGQTTAFFENADQMGLPGNTRVFLQSEGITNVDDLEEFVTSDSWSQLLENCKRPPQITDAAGNLVNQAAFRIGAKSLRRMKVAAKCVAYYMHTNRDRVASNMMWASRLSVFEVAWQALVDLKDSEGSNKLPILTKNFAIDRWLESYANYADQRIGVRMCPLSYVIRDDAAVPAPAPPLLQNAPYSVEHGSLKDEMKARFSHQHPLFGTDNGSVFDDLEEATRGTKYQPTITPFKRAKDGRGAYMALKEQFAGPAVWDKKKTNAMEFLQSRKFTGTSNLSLEAFLGLHRSSYVTLQRCAEHINCQMPDQRSRVQYLLENIQAEDSNVKAALSSIRLDDTPNGMRNNFESAAAFLLPTDPVEKKKSKNKRPIADVSSANADAPPKKLGVHKKGTGKTGVQFRYYKPSEFKKLTKEQVDELLEYRRQKGDDGGRRNTGKRMRSSISSVLKSALKDIAEEQTKKNEAEAEGVELQNALIASLKSLNGAKEGDPKASISSLTPANQPRKNGKGKSVAFASPPGDGGAEVAVAKLVKIMRSMSSGGKNGSH